MSVLEPFRAHLRRAAELDAHPVWTPDDGALPALYLSHGAPPTFEDAGWMGELHGWARSLPKPRALLVVSAHWESDDLGITSTEPTGLVYDFGGFDPAYYRLRYDTPPAGALAADLTALLPGPLFEHRGRGLDHGAWVPLSVMYPDADVPVLQLSLPARASAEQLLALGARLRPLRDSGVLVVGSGFMTHGLPYLDWSRPDQVPGWSREFDLWAADALARGDVEELSHFRTRAPGVRYAHPTVEHFTPLFVTLGAATDPAAPVQTAIEGFAMGLAKRSVQAS